RLPHVERREDGGAAREREPGGPQGEGRGAVEEREALAVPGLDLVAGEEHDAAAPQSRERLDPEEGGLADDDLVEALRAPPPGPHAFDEPDPVAVVDDGRVAPERGQLHARDLVVPHVERRGDDSLARRGGLLEALAADRLAGQVLPRARAPGAPPRA